MEVEIDRELSTVIARRQPTARDLRLLMAISKTTANLERVGDEAERIARMVQSIMNAGSGAMRLRCRPASWAWLATWPPPNCVKCWMRSPGSTPSPPWRS